MDKEVCFEIKMDDKTYSVPERLMSDFYINYIIPHTRKMKYGKRVSIKRCRPKRSK